MKPMTRLYAIFLLLIGGMLVCTEANAQDKVDVTLYVKNYDNQPLPNESVIMNGKEYRTDHEGVVNTKIVRPCRNYVSVYAPGKCCKRGCISHTGTKFVDMNKYENTMSIYYTIDNNCSYSLSANDIRHLPTRDMATMLSALGVPTSGSSAGSRPKNTVYYIDGVMVRGGGGITGPQDNSFRK